MTDLNLCSCISTRRLDCRIKHLLLGIIRNLIDLVQKGQVRLIDILKILKVKCGKASCCFCFCISGLATRDGDGIICCVLEYGPGLSWYDYRCGEAERAEGEDGKRCEVHVGNI
ncbi:hypothetical protein BM1_09361 [Bipolaris maydis]|nr:hypothetical protein BM1_09361 [Bipolaris maydis]